MPDRFLTQDQVAGKLATSKAQVYALIRRGDLRALKIGGRGVWRVAREDPEAFIEATFGETEEWIHERPFNDDETDDEA